MFSNIVQHTRIFLSYLRTLCQLQSLGPSLPSNGNGKESNKGERNNEKECEGQNGLFVLICNSSIFLELLMKSIKAVDQNSQGLSRFLKCISLKQSRNYNKVIRTVKTHN